MNLLKDVRKMIQYEAFHVFKVFVVNPNMGDPVRRELYRNKQKLLAFLPKFLADRTDDDQFVSYFHTLRRRFTQPNASADRREELPSPQQSQNYSRRRRSKE